MIFINRIFQPYQIGEVEVQYIRVVCWRMTTMKADERMYCQHNKCQAYYRWYAFE